MPRPKSELIIKGAVEGVVDEAVLRRLLVHVGATPGPIYGKNGKDRLLKQIAGYNNAARLSPWVVLVDLDQDHDCAPPTRERWLPRPEPKMCFRVVVHEIEAWLMADRERLSSFLGVALSLVPQMPESINHPKRRMVQLAARSRRREILEDMVPRKDSGRTTGPAYASRLIEFVSGGTAPGWRPDAAAESSDSLVRCLHYLNRLVKG
ncbi:MAG: hypothetical protein JRJ59_02150 [Deltaproteobacteria bacterium]|nr:hypothetical protein [Deltaproteobacteria bacterium]